MNILHYTLGLPPMRSGGLTGYAMSLMSSQSQNDNVSLLYPGRELFFSKKRKVHERTQFGRIKVFELCNPMLVPLLYGVSTPSDILHDKHQFSEKELEIFYSKIQPEVFHIHTLMGIPKELLSFMKKKGVCIVYTSHDYYGLCPKVNLIDSNGNPCNIAECSNCSLCNSGSPSSRFLKIRNSEFLLKAKNNPLLRKLVLK